MFKKDKDITLMEFRKVRNYANFAIISLVLGLIIFTIFSIYLKKVTLGLIIFFYIPWTFYIFYSELQVSRLWK